MALKSEVGYRGHKEKRNKQRNKKADKLKIGLWFRQKRSESLLQFSKEKHGIFLEETEERKGEDG